MPYPPFDIGILRTGHFVVYKNKGGFFTDLIEKYQIEQGIDPEHAKFVHVDVLGPRQWAIRVNPPRAKIVEIDKYYKGREAIVVKYKDLLFDSRRQYVAWWAVSHNNLDYDYLGILKFKLRWLFHRKDLFFCSENSATALRKEFPEAFKGMEPFTVLPAHFLGHEFEIVWRGIIDGKTN